MPRSISKPLLGILIGVCMLPFVTDAFLLSSYHQGAIPGVKIDAQHFSDGVHTLEPRLLQEGDPIDSRYTAHISREELRPLKGKSPALLLSRINAQGCRVYWNGRLIGSVGDPDLGRANIWNTPFLFPIDPGLVAAENELSFEMHHEYDAGIEGMVILADLPSARRMLGALTITTGALNYIGMGMTLCGCILILLMILLNQRRNSPFISMVVSLVALAVYALDFTYIPHLPVSYLAYKKIVIAALFISLVGTSLTISKLFYRKLPVIVSLAALALIAVGIAVSRDMETFKRIYQFGLALIPIALVTWLGVIIPCLHIKEEAKIFFFGLLLFLFVTIYNMLALFLFPGLLSGSIFPFAIVYMTIVILLMNLDIKRKNETIQQESSRRFHFYRKAITDGLTGLFNRDYMIAQLEKEKPPFAVAMLDIDNFKNVNDDYGHQAGDRMIQFAGKMLTSILRDTDKVGRYGGDEFIVILRSCGPNAYSIMERFRAEIANSYQSVDGQLLNITFSIGICYVLEQETADQILRKADKALYLAKQNGRNMVCIYE